MMKNELVILLDTESEDSIRIGKMNTPPPTSEEEFKNTMLMDMATCAEALVVMIRAAHKMGVKNEADSMRDIMKHLNEAFVDTSMEAEVRIDKLLKS